MTKKTCKNCVDWEDDGTGHYGNCGRGACGVRCSYSNFDGCNYWTAKPKPAPVKTCLNCKHHLKGTDLHDTWYHICTHPDTTYRVLKYTSACTHWTVREQVPTKQNCLNCRWYHKMSQGHYCDNLKSAFFGWNDSAQGCNDWEANPEPEFKPDGLQMTPGEREDALTKYMYRSLGIPWVEPEPELEETCLNCKYYMKGTDMCNKWYHICTNQGRNYMIMKTTRKCGAWKAWEEP